MKNLKGLVPSKKDFKAAAPKMAGAVIGGIGVQTLKTGIEKLVPAEYQSPKVNIGVSLLIGAGLAANKDPLISGIGMGILGVVGKEGAHEFLGIGDPYLGDIPQYIQIEGLDDGMGNNMIGYDGGEASY